MDDIIEKMKANDAESVSQFTIILEKLEARAAELEKKAIQGQKKVDALEKEKLIADKNLADAEKEATMQALLRKQKGDRETTV